MGKEANDEFKSSLEDKFMKFDASKTQPYQIHCDKYKNYLRKKRELVFDLMQKTACFSFFGLRLIFPEQVHFTLRTKTQLFQNFSES